MSMIKWLLEMVRSSNFVKDRSGSNEVMAVKESRVRLVRLIKPARGCTVGIMGKPWRLRFFNFTNFASEEILVTAGQFERVKFVKDVQALRGAMSATIEQSVNDK